MGRSALVAMVAILTLLFSNPATAQVIAEADAQKIVAQQLAIRKDAEVGAGRYREMDARTKRDLAAHQEKVLQLLDGRSSTTELSGLDQLAVFNALEAISAIVNKAEDERMICRREKPIGSNRPVNVCRTVAQLREAREALEQNGGSVRTRGVCMPGDCNQSGF